jgi:hypothetical protein
MYYDRAVDKALLGPSGRSVKIIQAMTDEITNQEWSPMDSFMHSCDERNAVETAAPPDDELESCGEVVRQLLKQTTGR